MVGVEIDIVVPDSLEALKLYRNIFDVEPLEVSDYDKGLNEVVFTLYGTRFHMLDENPQYQLIAPKPDDPKPMWLNVLVPSIRDVYEKAINAGCTEIQPITEIPQIGVINAMFSDPMGYVWMLHEITREVSYDERKKTMEEMMGG